MVDYEDSMLFPAKLFNKKFGIGMDFGSSIVKTIYTSEEGENIRVHFLNFSRQNYKKAFQFLKEKCVGRLGEGLEVYTCGIGVSTYITELQDALNVRIVNTSEMDRMMDGFMFLAANHSVEDWLHPQSARARHQGATLARGLLDLWPKMHPEGRIQGWKFTDAENAELLQEGRCHVTYPVHVALVGSRASTWKLYADGTYTQCGSNAVAGRTFLGLGSLLTDAQDYSRLMELSVQGDHNQVDQMLSVLGANDKDAVYQQCNELHAKCFAFGHAAGKKCANFSQSDLAAAVMSLVAQTTAHDAFSSAMVTGIKQVFFIGGFSGSHDTVRNYMEQEFAFRSYANLTGHVCDCRFVRNGGHASALGALIKNLQLVK